MLKGHLLVTRDSAPLEFFLTPAATADVTGLRDFDLPEGALVVGDKAYKDYEMEDVLETAGIHLRPCRKHNSTRATTPLVLSPGSLS